ncbi:MAG: hypothetical protein WC054_01390 [Candidatus Nanopelagicales bacterium]
MSELDEFRTKIIEMMAGAARCRDLASDAVGPLARAVVSEARVSLLGESRMDALAEMDIEEYPDWEYFPPGTPIPDVKKDN